VNSGWPVGRNAGDPKVRLERVGREEHKSEWQFEQRKQPEQSEGQRRASAEEQLGRLLVCSQAAEQAGQDATKSNQNNNNNK